MNEKSEGILLSSLAYLGQKKILKVFTPDAGLLTLISSSPKLTQLTSPFSLAEWVYRKTQRELFSLQDGTLLDGFSELRAGFETLSAAGSIASDILHSQLPGKSSPKLYELLAAYFQRLKKSPHPEALALSFRVKLLLHEGLLSVTPACAKCDQPAQSLAAGESLCPDHSLGEVRFTQEEWESLLVLAHGRQFSFLEAVSVTDRVRQQIEELFLTANR